jgi:hypothetical protein
MKIRKIEANNTSEYYTKEEFDEMTLLVTKQAFTNVFKYTDGEK